MRSVKWKTSSVKMSCWLRRLQQLHYYESRFINNKSFPKGNLGVVDVQYDISEADPCLIYSTSKSIPQKYGKKHNSSKCLFVP